MLINTIQLREYQAAAVDALRHALMGGKRRIILQASCGAGKTIISAEIAKLAIEKNKRVLFLVNRRDLVRQTAEKYEAFGLGDKLGLIMAGEEPSLARPIQLATLQTYSRRLKITNLEWNKWFHNADLVIYDECHSANAPTYRDILKLYKDKPIIGLSATPMGAQGKGLGKIFEEIVPCISMNKLIEKEFLVPAVHYAPSKPDLEGVKITAGDYNKKQLGERVNKTKLVGDILDNWLRLASDRQTIVFATNVKHSKHIREVFEKNGVSIAHIDAHTNDEDRQDIYRGFESGDIQVLTNVGVCCEGSDLPIASAVVIAKPTLQLGRWIQMAGRGARPYPGKKDFLILDHAGCVERHGFCDEDVSWFLDVDKLATGPNKKREKEKTIIVCDMCKHAFTGRRCPNCGFEIKDYGKRIETAEAELVKVKGEKKKTYTQKDKSLWFAMFEYEKRRLQKTNSWKLAQYKSKFGVWPRMLDELPPMEPTKECKNFLTHQRIKWIKSKQRAA